MVKLKNLCRHTLSAVTDWLSQFAKHKDVAADAAQIASTVFWVADDASCQAQTHSSGDGCSETSDCVRVGGFLRAAPQKCWTKV